MAKQLTYKRSTVEAISIKGNLNNESNEITYLDEDKNECTIKVQDLLDKFASQTIALSIKTQADEDLTDDLEEDDEVDADDLTTAYED